MIIGKVIGSVVATRKHEKLVGSKFLVIDPLRFAGGADQCFGLSDKFVAVDHIGAGIGDIVLVARGSAARLACPLSDTPCDAAVVGIVEDAQGRAEE